MKSHNLFLDSEGRGRTCTTSFGSHQNQNLGEYHLSFTSECKKHWRLLSLLLDWNNYRLPILNLSNFIDLQFISGNNLRRFLNSFATEVFSSLLFENGLSMNKLHNECNRKYVIKGKPRILPTDFIRSERTWTFMHHYSNYTARFIRPLRYAPI